MYGPSIPTMLGVSGKPTSADGQKFLVVDDGAATSRPLTLVQNWTGLLKK